MPIFMDDGISVMLFKFVERISWKEVLNAVLTKIKETVAKIAGK